MLRITESTHQGNDYATRHYDIHPKHKPEYAYAIWDNNLWRGVIMFSKPASAETQFDKWQGQVQEMYIAIERGTDIPAAISLALDALQAEAPFVDVVISRDSRANGKLSLVGRHGDGKKGAYIINGDRIHPKTVRQNGWRPSVLWLREHVDAHTTQFDRDAQDLYAIGLNDRMRERLTRMEVR